MLNLTWALAPAALALAALGPGAARGPAAATAAPPLDDLAAAAQTDHQPISTDAFAVLRSSLRDTAHKLEHRLRSQQSRPSVTTTPSLVDGWKAYLHWDWLQPHLEVDSDPTIDRQALEQLREIVERLHANQAGLEAPEFVNLREIVQRYRVVAPWAMVAAQRDPRDDYARLIRGLQEQLQRHQSQSTSETAWKIGRVMGVVDQLGDSPELVNAIRDQYARTNIRANVSANFINASSARPVDTTRPVRDFILGTRIYGTSRTLGTVSYHFAQASDQVELEVRLSGNAHSRTTGYNGPVRIGSIGNTSINASKRLMISDNAFRTAGAQADAVTRTRICSIRKTGGKLGHRLIEKIAWKRAGQQKAAAERIAARHAEQQAASSFDREVFQALATGRTNYLQKVRAPLIRRGVLPDDLRMHSTHTHVQIAATLANENQLAAGTASAPHLPPQDLTFQIHETALSNYLPLVLAGVTIRQNEPQTPPELQGRAPQWLREAARRTPPATPHREDSVEGKQQHAKADEAVAPFKPWAIQLNHEAPVSVTFDEGRVTLRVRAAVLESEATAYENWDFLVSYRVAQQGNQIVLRRDGPIEVFPTGFDPAWDKRMSSRKSGFRSTLSQNMNARADAGEGFPAEIPIAALQISQLGTMRLDTLLCDDGWLTVSWSLPEEQ
jgi:hypothetical protein